MPKPHPQKFTGAEVRKTFLDFFAERGHTVVPSASLIPSDDPTLLFSNSGMVQFKDVFLGTGDRPYSRAVDSQKCMRVSGKHNDLDDVGRDDSHHTFFEMLGNWSFGDYYKKDAIAWAWKLLTEVWNLPRDHLWATCFEDDQGVIPRDDEAAGYWLQQPGFDPKHLLFFGRDENFWEMAELGPCGPDSEIHFDRGPEHCNLRDISGHTCRVNGDCTRFLELWNLVFIQYNRISQTDLEPLPSKHVDTGMGLERIVSLLQGKRSNYHTDLFSPLLDRIQGLSSNTNDEREANATAYRVVADHARAATFLISDGVIPGNTGRNYVCRMVLRRASRFGKQVGFSEPFLAKVAETVIDEYGNSYRELQRNRGLILRTITDEERRFQRTVDSGLSQLNLLIEDLNKRQEQQLAGSDAFELYATYGLPIEITRDILREHQLRVDEDAFDTAMESHRAASGAGQAMGVLHQAHTDVYTTMLEQLHSRGSLIPDGVQHNPYGTLETRGQVLALLSNGKAVDAANAGDTVEVVLAHTPFYVESGGQLSDKGTIAGCTKGSKQLAWEIKITDTRQPIVGLVTHMGEVITGTPTLGDRALARIDSSRRADIERNHTATHLLHAELRSLLGDHVRQAGSLVASDRLRFDFTHDVTLTEVELTSLTKNVANAVLSNHPVTADYQNRNDALSGGAIALFGEKYGEVVRTIRIGDTPDPISFELCGGTHVTRTGDIGTFTIVAETSVASGVRRIEALTGHAAHDHIQQRLSVLNKVASQMSTSPDELDRKVLSLLQSEKRLQKTMSSLQSNQAQQQFERSLDGLTQVDGVAVLSAKMNVHTSQLLREMTDWFRQRIPSGVAVFGANIKGRPTLMAAVTKDLTKRGLHAGTIVGTIAEIVGGRGGGKATFAQAGGKNPDRLPEALSAVVDIVAQALAASREP